MRTTSKDGGPAFPHPVAIGPAGDVYSSSDVCTRGLSMRDWFAGQALAGMHARDTYDEGQRTPERRARLAYLDADAMLAARALSEDRP